MPVAWGLVAALLPLTTCAKKPPAKPDSGPANTTHASENAEDPGKERAPPRKPPPLTTAQAARLAAIKATSGQGWCELSKTADPDRDKAILSATLQLAFEARRSEADRDCSFALLKAMGANEQLLPLAKSTVGVGPWLAILAWATRNLRAKHFAVYELGLEQPELLVRKAAAAAVGQHAASPPALGVLDKALADKDPTVRLAAVKAGYEMSDATAIERLKARLTTEKDDRVRAALQRAIAGK